MRPTGNGSNPITKGQAVKLTAPWNEMNLTIGAGVIEDSSAAKRTVRFPGTDRERMKGLAAAISQDLVKAGWSEDESQSTM